jgi:hypothetical protein
MEEIKMAKEWIDMCVGCESCIAGCCKSKKVLVTFCDKCDFELTSENYLRSYDGMELCDECTANEIIKKFNLDENIEYDELYDLCKMIGIEEPDVISIEVDDDDEYDPYDY